MNDMPVLTDALLEAAFERRAARGEPDGVYSRIVDVVSQTPQRRGLRSAVRSRRDGAGGLRLLAVAVLTAAAVTGLAVVGSRPTRPVPAPSTTRLIGEFVQPFQYHEEPSNPFTIRYRTPTAIAFADIGDYVGYVSSAYPRTPDGQPLPSSWGIVLASPAGTSVEGCRATGHTGEIVLRDAPADLMDDLRRIDGVALAESVASLDRRVGRRRGVARSRWQRVPECRPHDPAERPRTEQLPRHALRCAIAAARRGRRSFDDPRPDLGLDGRGSRPRHAARSDVPRRHPFHA